MRLHALRDRSECLDRKHPTLLSFSFAGIRPLFRNTVHFYYFKEILYLHIKTRTSPPSRFIFSSPHYPSRTDAAYLGQIFYSCDVLKHLSLHGSRESLFFLRLMKRWKQGVARHLSPFSATVMGKLQPNGEIYECVITGKKVLSFQNL